MDRLLEAERRFLRMACPGCASAGSLQAAGKCALDHGECLYTVRCQRCEVVFELSTETTSPRMFQPELHAWLSGLACPACLSAGAEVVFRCEILSWSRFHPPHSRFYRVRCANCGHEYAAERVAVGQSWPGSPG